MLTDRKNMLTTSAIPIELRTVEKSLIAKNHIERTLIEKIRIEIIRIEATHTEKPLAGKSPAEKNITVQMLPGISNITINMSADMNATQLMINMLTRNVIISTTNIMTALTAVTTVATTAITMAINFTAMSITTQTIAISIQDTVWLNISLTTTAAAYT